MLRIGITWNVAYRRFSNVQVFIFLPDPWVSNSCMRTFPDNKWWICSGLTHKFRILTWDLRPSIWNVANWNYEEQTVSREASLRPYAYPPWASDPESTGQHSDPRAVLRITNTWHSPRYLRFAWSYEVFVWTTAFYVPAEYAHIFWSRATKQQTVFVFCLSIRNSL